MGQFNRTSKMKHLHLAQILVAIVICTQTQVSFGWGNFRGYRWLTIHGKGCINDGMSWMQKGCKKLTTNYYWCWHNPYTREWDYCSPTPPQPSAKNPAKTRYNEDCKNDCTNKGHKYYWCWRKRGGWDYCSPPCHNGANYRGCNDVNGRFYDIYTGQKADGCFPGVSQVMLEGGEKKSMEDIRVGDVIVSMDSGKLVSTIVLGFLDKRINQTTKYLNINIEDGESLFISPTHAIFIKGDDNSIKSVLAKEVNPGDMVVTENGFSQVKLVTLVVKSGAYVPLTDAGTLMVDGVLVSSYTNAPHWLAHIVLAPLRWWPTLLLDTEESQHIEGVKAYPWMVKNLGNFLGLADVSVPNDKIESVDFPKMGMSSPRLIPNKMDKFEL